MTAEQYKQLRPGDTLVCIKGDGGFLTKGNLYLWGGEYLLWGWDIAIQKADNNEPMGFSYDFYGGCFEFAGGPW